MAVISRNLSGKFYGIIGAVWRVLMHVVFYSFLLPMEGTVDERVHITTWKETGKLGVLQNTVQYRTERVRKEDRKSYPQFHLQSADGHSDWSRLRGGTCGSLRKLRRQWFPA